MSSAPALPVTPERPISRRGEPAWEIAYLFPIQGHWSESEYLALDTNHLVELVDGCLEVHAMATILHQLIVRFLHRILEEFVAKNASGQVLFAPLPIHLWRGAFREPDVVYLRPERIRDLRKQPEGADLVMEVVSEGAENRERDLETKRQEYAAAGIPEYWIVDPAEQKITVLTLEGQGYREHGTFGAGMQATSVLLPGFTINVSDAIAAGQG